jgi:hypothetical protein
MLPDSTRILAAILTEMVIVGIVIGTASGFVWRWLTRDVSSWSAIQTDFFASAVVSVTSALGLLPIAWAMHGRSGAIADRLATFALVGTMLFPPVVVVSLCAIRARRRKQARRTE